MKTHILTFTAPHRVELVTRDLPPLAEGQVLVQTLLSAISPGTEMLVYRGQFPRNMPVDACFPGMSDAFHYPLSYGYACAGKVIDVGKQVNPDWKGKLVFAFQPHAAHFITPAASLMSLPQGMLPETACFLPNAETAVNLVQDAAPLLGERALVLGQGVIGLLTAALLRRFPLETLVTTDFYPLRRAASQALGVSACIDAARPDLTEALRQVLPSGADLTLEVSGSPLALDTAIEHTAFSGRIVVGSWYGEKTAAIALGGKFHRSRIQLLSSQVSTIQPALSGRWDKTRRLRLAWKALAEIQPQRWVTHRIPFGQADEAYRLLDEHPQETIQILLEYP
ncbi:MAG: zinc-binding alcohol dehydrogenase [Anaerolineales bacterium]|nr:zinc-binding alcohol dehydrogenase [Anaerolineales bacterium]MCX7754654.1 zinc-binding alcohol dehydrogenase [Anaerolineales bacterium]MDW8278316.1 zinc-binding alcohol dehydrogenase [Anaerolineales bacterium]